MGLDTDEYRWEGIPEDLAQILQDWLDFAGLSNEGDRTIWVKQWARDKHGRVLYGQAGASVSEASLSTRVAGHSGCKSPFLAKPGSKTGYSAHRFRHLAEQAARTAGKSFLNANPGEDGRLTPRVFADALLDHTFAASDHLGYNDLERDRETLARVAAHGVWRILISPDGRRRAPDVDAQRQAQNRVDNLVANRDALQQQIADQRAEIPKLAHAPDAQLRMLELFQICWELRDSLDEVKDELSQALDARKAEETMTVPVNDRLTDAEYRALLEGEAHDDEDDARTDTPSGAR